MPARATLCKKLRGVNTTNNFSKYLLFDISFLAWRTTVHRKRTLFEFPMQSLIVYAQLTKKRTVLKTNRRCTFMKLIYCAYFTETINSTSYSSVCHESRRLTTLSSFLLRLPLSAVKKFNRYLPADSDQSAWSKRRSGANSNLTLIKPF